MTIRTNDTWVATLEPATRPGAAFRILTPPAPSDPAGSRGTLVTHAESDCSVVLCGVVYGDACDVAGDGDSNHAAVVLRAYLRDGDRCLASLRGVYSFVLWDARVATLLGVRDRLGIFPLFYTQDSGARWLLSPALDSLAAEPKVSRRLDPTVIAERLFDVRQKAQYHIW